MVSPKPPYPLTPASQPTLAVEPPDCLEAFSLRIEQEFIQGSAIDSELFQTAVRLCQDLEITATGDVETPIHEALNWHYTRFGQRARESLQAALLLNEDGSCWQAKLSRPLMDSSKGKPRKYETPKGNGSRAFLPLVPSDIRARIRDRYGIAVPLSGSFWDWLEDHPEVPIVLTEGGKKALSLLSLGYVAIALYGVNAGYRKDANGTYSLIPDVARFAVLGRKITLTFDQDADSKTRRKVNAALLRFGGLLKKAGCIVSIARWDGSGGCKGVDDLAALRGAKAVDQAVAEAIPFEHFGILLRLEGRLTYEAAVRLNIPDLSTLSIADLPQTGIIAITSVKATGKTKFLAKETCDADKVLAAGHRIALMRNLSERLGLTYRGDADKVHGRFIIGSSYTLRLGLVVDSFLAIDPEQFRGCTLILDEVVQVVRHLLTSSTCGKDGKRPALLARFQALVQTAERVIIADADLSNDELHYIQELRGDGAPAFLIRNDFQPEGYSATLIKSRDKTAIMASLLADLDKMPEGMALYVATDNKKTSEDIAQSIEAARPGKFPTLLINSDTSGGDIERGYVQAPDTGLPDGVRVIIGSPTIATGISAELQGKYYKVYGIFTGVSLSDSDMAQALARVREPVERVIWCTEFGRNFSKISRSTNFLELKRDLLDKTSTTISLVRSGLKADTAGAVEAIDWAADPHINMWAKIEADRNRSMFNLRESLLVRLRFEGNDVQEIEAGTNPALKLLLKTIRAESKEADARAILNARILSLPEVVELGSKEATDPEDRRAIERFWLCEFYAIEHDALTVELVLEDKGGRRRAELRSLEELLYLGVAADRTVKALEAQATWNQGICPWDIGGSMLRRTLREKLGLPEIVDRLKSGALQPEQYQECADRIRQYSTAIKQVLHLTINDEMNDVQVIHQLLRQLGITMERHQARLEDGSRLSSYLLDPNAWKEAIGILERRKTRRERLAQESIVAGTPLSFSGLKTLEGRGVPEEEKLKTPIYQVGDAVLVRGKQATIATVNSDEDGVTVEGDEIYGFVPLRELAIAS